MVELRGQRDVRLEYTFDRLLVAKLEQAYQILVPDQVRAVGGRSKLIGAANEDGGNLRPGFFGQAEGGEHHCQPNGSAGCLCRRAGLRGSTGMGVPRRRL
jgi:hypothetical protein